MEQHDDLFEMGSVSNLQIHELKPANKSNSFAALLEKFYLNSEEGKKAAVHMAMLDASVEAKSIIAEKKNKQ